MKKFLLAANYRSILQLSLIVGFSFFIYSVTNVTNASTEEEALDGNVNTEVSPPSGSCECNNVRDITRASASSSFYDTGSLTTFYVTGSLTTGITWDEFDNEYANCATPPEKTTFLDTDSHVFMWIRYENATIGDSYTSKWYKPGGVWVVTDDIGSVESGYENGCAMTGYYISGDYLSYYPGVWTVEVYRNGGLIVTKNFTIVSAKKYKNIAGTWKLYNGRRKISNKYLGTMTVSNAGEIESFSLHMPNDGGTCWDDKGFEAEFGQSSVNADTLSFDCKYSESYETSSVMTEEYSSSLNGKFKKKKNKYIIKGTWKSYHGAVSDYYQSCYYSDSGVLYGEKE